MPEHPGDKTELWSNDPISGEAILLETFAHTLAEPDLRALAIAIALPSIENLTLADLWSL